jgi:RNA polymerase sigma-70 factor (ECF subfamily)
LAASVSPPVEHLFRREAGRITATLVRIFGLRNLALAEDVVQEAFCRALEIWPFKGTPLDPAAWLMTTARNCARDALRRQRTVRNAAAGLADDLQSEWTLAPTLEELFAPDSSRDDLLRMMFSCCHPRLSETAQVALILNVLCGFSVGEVAAAFVQSEETIQKRIARAKKTLADSHTLFSVSAPGEFAARMEAVQRALYLLFNEGYHGASPELAVNAQLCAEARHLVDILLEHPLGALPSNYALAALMAFNAARLPGRVDSVGDLLTLADQDRTKWDSGQIAEGLRLLDHSATGSELSTYHIEAAIASLHATASGIQSTDWPAIVTLYGTLMSIAPTPVVALNRAIAIAQAHGPEAGLEAVRAMTGRERLIRYPFYAATLAELELRCGHLVNARAHFQAALALARNPAERRFLDRRIQACAEGSLAISPPNNP